MGFRITTNMMMNTYRYNLQGTTKKLSDARDKVLTHRNFNSYAEDPASATQAFRLRRDYYRTSDQVYNNSNTYNKFDTAWQNLTGIVNKLSDATSRVASIQGVTGTAGESRKALAQVLRETADSVIQGMNQKLGDQFIFAGNDGLKVPFSWSEDGKTLYYRGVNVNAGKVEKPVAEEPNWIQNMRADGAAAGDELAAKWADYYSHKTDVKPDTPADDTVYLKLYADPSDPTLSAEQKGWADYYMHKTDAPPTAAEPAWKADPDNFDMVGAPIVDKLPQPLSKEDQAWVDYYKDQSDLQQLKEMAGEELYIDLGMGLQESAPNQPIKGSYFNAALCGVDFVNYGVDTKDGSGDPKNLALIMKELADVFETWGENGQKYLPEKYREAKAEDIKAILEAGGPEAEEINKYHTEMEAKAFRLMDKLKAAQEHTTEKWIEVEAKSKFLVTNQDRLTDQQTNINEQVLDVEQIDLADAITQFSWNQYCYNSALKIGNQLLSQSLIDYMR